MLLLLWRRPAAVDLIRSLAWELLALIISLAWELLYAAGSALKSEKTNKKKNAIWQALPGHVQSPSSPSEAIYAHVTEANSEEAQRGSTAGTGG